MIKVYWLDCTPLFDERELTRILPTLDETRREKTLRYKTAERRAQSAGAGLLLRHIFGDTAYVFGENGKPYFKDRDDLFFSLSHSGKYVVCAVADCEIGVDLELVSPIRPAVMRRCFTPQEQAWIENDPVRFTRLWTMKEAYMKLTGTGLSVPAKEITLPTPPKDEFDEKNRCFWSLWDRNDVILSLSSERSDDWEIVPVSLF